VLFTPIFIAEIFSPDFSACSISLWYLIARFILEIKKAERFFEFLAALPQISRSFFCTRIETVVSFMRVNVLQLYATVNQLYATIFIHILIDKYTQM